MGGAAARRPSKPDYKAPVDAVSYTNCSMDDSNEPPASGVVKLGGGESIQYTAGDQYSFMNDEDQDHYNSNYLKDFNRARLKK